ncbi:MAG TPA: anthranilate synthase component I family protein [Thermodesulfovibrionales bacterium]|nr:anthranilate synthase component I family protein [Thermodesulfovibrionales bacterium]
MQDSAFAPSVTKEEFLALCGSGPVPPLYVEIPYLAPEQAYPLFSGPESFLLESVKGPEKIARYSFLGFEPSMTFKVKDGIVEIAAEEQSSLSRERPLKSLNQILHRYLQKPLPELPPFQGGLVGFLSYDFVHYLERLPKTTADDLRIPDAHFFIIDRLIAFDHIGRKAWIIVCPGARSAARDRAQWYEEAEDALARIGKTLSAGKERKRSGKARLVPPKIELLHEMKKEQYLDMVRRAKEYIAAGDIFQANLSQRVSAYVGGLEPWDLYMTLRTINPSPFAGLIDFGSYSIVSSSPERLVRLKDCVAEVRPIAGTRPRGKDMKEDKRMREELLLNEKERAEHIMLIDLERNDLGKVCDYGSIEVDELMITEDYSHVIHIVSNVRGVLARNKTAIDVIRAVFPGGTITGVPKVRCMEIIDELEPVRRGPYTGSMGYVGFSGNMDLNIIIRTFVIKDGYAYVQAGAGIVADSDPEREFHETLKKAEALIKTLERIKI